MDQKNTIVKCYANPTCLFNYNGTCDNYMISIGEDGKCDCYVETEQKTCHPDCIHFDDSDIMVGPICLFNHPEPLKNFYEGMPCDYYHSTNYTRGQRANCNVFDDMMDIDDKHLGEAVTVKIPDPKDMDIHFTIQNAQWNKEFLRDQMCWYCDNGSKGCCKLTAKPSLDRTGKCPCYKSTGGNR